MLHDYGKQAMEWKHALLFYILNYGVVACNEINYNCYFLICRDQFNKHTSEDECFSAN